MWKVELVASISPQKPEFNPRPVLVRLVMVRVAMGYAMNLVPRFYPVRIIPPMLRTHLHLSATQQLTPALNDTREIATVRQQTTHFKTLLKNNSRFTVISRICCFRSANNTMCWTQYIRRTTV
jgi:hypothetical protein